MSENTNIEAELSEQDVADLKKIGIDLAEDVENAPARVCLLTAWKDVFSNVAAARAKPISLAEASRTVATWPKISFQETAIYHERYLGLLQQLADKLDDVRPAAFEFKGDDDGIANREDYIALLVEWHIVLDEHKDAWEATHPESHIEAAALADAGGFIFNEVGLLGHLGAIGLELDEQTFMQRVRDEQEKRGEK